MAGRSEAVEKLRRKIAEPDAPTRESALLGVAAVDEALYGGLMRGVLHEIAVAETTSAGAGLGFASSLLAKLLAAGKGSAQWMQQVQTGEDGGRLYRTGLLAYGVSPQRLLVAEPSRSEDLLWAMEQGAHCSALEAVIAEVWRSPRPCGRIGGRIGRAGFHQSVGDS